jgi:excalibur calcium-binding domain-containing protein
VVAVVILALALAGRGGDGGGNDGGGSPERTTSASTPKPERRAHAASRACPPAEHALDGVYHPERLRVIDPCRAASGRVTVLREEEDGDLHFDVELDRPYRGMLAAANLSQQHGDLVVEFMPRDRGHLPVPKVGDRVRLVGAFVDDTDHGWNELHPVWQVSIGRGPRFRSGPRYGGSAPEARSRNAVEECRTAHGRRCHAYVMPFGGGGAGIVRRPGDRNCSDFATQREAQRYYVSKGGPARDPDRLDADRNGRACESLP